MKGLILLILLFSSFFSALYATGKKEKPVHRASYAISSCDTITVTRPHAFDFVKNIPTDYKTFCKNTFQKSQIGNIAAIALSTAILIKYDQNILDDAQQFGRHVHIAGTSNSVPIVNGKVTIASKEVKLQLNVPTDLNSSFYFLGDGWTHTTIALSFWAVGLLTNDDRAIRTSTALGECILTTGICTQFIKHITGRESPFTTQVSGGTWRFFPNQKEYANHVPHYDAFPTGHLATAMATVTVIAENYPEHPYIRPVGYTLMGILGFAMLNNGVHWAGDYPLGIALGYAFGKIAVSHGRSFSGCNQKITSDTKWKFTPSISATNVYNGFGLGVTWKLKPQFTNSKI